MTNPQTDIPAFLPPEVEFRTQKSGYAPVLALAFILWPIAAMLGTQGFTLIVAITGLAALGFVKVKRPSISDLALVIAFLAWITVTQFWSPAGGQFISGNIFEGNFAVKSTGLRVCLLATVALLTIYAAKLMPRGSAQMSAQIMIFAFLVQGVIVVSSPIIAPLFIDAIYAGNTAAQLTEGVQNLIRNANAFAMVLPILLAYFWTREGIVWKVLPVLIFVMSIWAFVRLDAQGAALAAFTSVLFMGFMHLVSTAGLKHILRGSAAYIAVAPLIIGFAVRVLPLSSASMPNSFRSRAWAWESVTEYIAKSPFFGHGLDASNTWRETLSAYPERIEGLPPAWADFPVIPGHPHNMPLEIWAETGLVGAMLISWAVAVMALRFADARQIRKDVRYAIAGLIGAVFVISSTAYSVWNDSFWAGVALAAAGLILLAKRERGSISQ